MNALFAKVIFASSAIMLASSLPALAQQSTFEGAPTTAQQVETAPVTPPTGEQSAAIQAQEGSLDTHLRLLNNLSSIKPGATVTLQYQTDPGAYCSLTAEVTEAIITSAASKMADSKGRVSFQVQVQSNFRGTELPLMISTSHNGKNQSIETRIPLQFAVRKK